MPVRASVARIMPTEQLFFFLGLQGNSYGSRTLLEHQQRHSLVSDKAGTIFIILKRASAEAGEELVGWAVIDSWALLSSLNLPLTFHYLFPKLTKVQKFSLNHEKLN